MSNAILCKQCRSPVEEHRLDWATPICFACLPPPAPLRRRHVNAESCRCDACQTKRTLAKTKEA